jgi:transposase-like protein
VQGETNLKRRRYSDEEKAVLVNRTLLGETLADISRETGVSYVLLSRWRQEYQVNGQFGHRNPGKKKVVVTFQEAQSEIKHLRRQLDDKSLEIMVLSDLLKKNEGENQ